MYYAPVGLFAYFAYLVGVFGPELLGSYVRAMVLYYPVAILYFFVASLLCLFGAKGVGVRRFWKNIILPPSLLLQREAAWRRSPPTWKQPARQVYPKISAKS